MSLTYPVKINNLCEPKGKINIKVDNEPHMVHRFKYPFFLDALLRILLDCFDKILKQIDY